MDVDRNARLIRWTVVAGLLCEMALCPRLWTSQRAFPVAPAASWLPEVSNAVTLGLVGAFVAALLVPARRWALGLTIFLAGALIALDLNRLQPWLFASLLLLVSLSLPKGRPVAGFALVAIYVWSGLQKLNMTFATVVFPWLLQPFGGEGLQPLWFFAPLIEVGTGVLLFLPKTRQFGLATATAMHGFLLFALGPSGHGYNPVVWPWNLWMPALVWLVFIRYREPLWPTLAGTWPGRAVGVLAGVLPALSFFGLWDENLSFSLYSGKTRQGFLLLSPKAAARLPPELAIYLERRPDRVGFDLARWSLKELNVPPYPEARTFRSAADRIRRLVAPETVTLVVSRRPGIFDRQTTMERLDE